MKLSYEVYRDGKSGTGLQERIREAVRNHYVRHRCLPTVVVVNPKEAQEAQKALEALDLRVPLETAPGCLIPEVWLGWEVGEEWPTNEPGC